MSKYLGGDVSCYDTTELTGYTSIYNVKLTGDREKDELILEK